MGARGLYFYNIAMALLPSALQLVERGVHRLPSTVPDTTGASATAPQISGNDTEQHQPANVITPMSIRPQAMYMDQQPMFTIDGAPHQHHNFHVQQPVTTTNTIAFQGQEMPTQQRFRLQNAVIPSIQIPTLPAVTVHATTNQLPNMYGGATPSLSGPRTDENSSQGAPLHPQESFTSGQWPGNVQTPALGPHQYYQVEQGLGTQFPDNEVAPLQRFGQVSGYHLGLEGQQYQGTDVYSAQALDDIQNLAGGPQPPAPKQPGTTDPQNPWELPPGYPSQQS